ncbi:GTP-binding protein [Methylovirgula sp. HY1]|uniref:CobW family GTP-binding protein n=1 Tax=Methylovirgula sp. HY1 TaxID=2822761 RepID=UPI001C5B0946|nr:GTP-binding protein [Methylovirgula sp. HY1]QXX75508.1 putative GTP-binding protein YjiA [Methylovirgula sp. HY1]
MHETARRPPAPFPLTVLTGFLGAGKTTLLNRLLREPALADTLVLINEFGEIGLDHLLVEKIDGDMVVMTSGCLCCTIRGDLTATLEDLLRRRDNGRIAPFTRVVIETTGLADPAPVLHTLMYHPYLTLRFRLDGVVTLVDALNGDAILDRHAEAIKQVAVADRLVITKTDLLDASGGATRLRARLSALNPTALQFDAARGEAVAEKLLNIGLYDPDRKIPDVRRWLNAEALVDQHGHAHHGQESHAHDSHAQDSHTHDINRHDAKIRAFALRHSEPMPVSAFEMFLELLRTAHGAHLLRVKGIVALADDPARPLVIHGVQHMFHPPARLETWPDDDRTTRIVFILYDMDPAFIEALWKGFAGLSAPDRAASDENQSPPAGD